MVGSTAKFIAYEMRPAKQTERRGIVEYLSVANAAGLTIPRYRYVGFGGTKFVDFQLMKSHIGFSSYQSIEQDPDIIDRCKFNRPFPGISLFEGGLSDFLAADEYEGNSVFWLDYEGGPTSKLTQELNTVGVRANLGDVVFVSVSGELPTRLERATDKLGYLRSILPARAASINRLNPIDFTTKKYPDTVGRLLVEMLQSSFSVRLLDGRFYPRFRVIYKDSTWMVTVGGSFVRNRSRVVGRMNKLLSVQLDAMCPRDRHTFYRIPNFNFSQLERLLIEKSYIGKRSLYFRRLKSLGISEQDLIEFERIARFVPRYAEVAF